MTPRLRLALSLSCALFCGLSLAACDVASDPDEPTGRACEIHAEAATCSDGATAYCDFMDGAKEFGPCIAPEELECEPGEVMDLGPRSDPEMQDICGNMSKSCVMYGGVPSWENNECNTPLVLRFDDRAIEMIDAEATPAATFDISMRADSCISTDWPSAATPWLVVDLDGSGTIDGGHELFGSGSRLADGHHADDGFAALAEFDSNHDGAVDRSDARFGELMLWRDWDADRVSTPDELEPLAVSGVDRLALGYEVDVQCDARGNCGVQRAGFEHAGGAGEIVDLYLACH